MNVRLLSLSLLLIASSVATAGDWPRFLGPNGTGVSDEKGIPDSWKPENILFKTAIPGKGHSSPIVSKGKVFLQTSSVDQSERSLVCLDAMTGKILWQKKVPGGGAKTHQKSSPASNTPAADGERIYAVFWDGSNQFLTAWDYDGKLLYNQDLGKFVNEHGSGMSPVVVGDKIVLNNDQGNQMAKGPAHIQAHDAKTGKLLWKKERDPERASFATPFLLEKSDSGPEVIVATTGGVSSYNPKDGAQNWHFVWKFDKNRLRTVGSPVFHQGLIFAIAGDGGGNRNMIALKADGKGDVTNTAMVWQKKKGTAYVPSLVAKDGLVFWIDDKVNVVYCADAKTGNELWNERLGGDSVSASPVIIDGKLYVINEKGAVFVLNASKDLEVLAKNDLKEQVYASPAVANGRMYIRTFDNLYCIGTK